MGKGIFKPFTESEEQYIRDNYLDIPFKHLANYLKCSDGRIKRFLNRNGLIVPDHIVDERRKSYQFKKGHDPHNKGCKVDTWMSSEGIEKIKRTQFKKGQDPHNTLKDGDVVIWHNTDTRKYYQIRLAPRKWMLLHQYIWINANGPIPDGYIISFKDGDTLNVDLDNLELISRVENLFRNSKHNFPPEIIPSMVLINQLENQLKKIQDAE